MKDTGRRAGFLLIETFISVAVPIVWLSMFFRKGGSSILSSPGFTSLRYYTVLSNLVAGAGSLWCLISFLRRGRTGGAKPGQVGGQPRMTGREPQEQGQDQKAGIPAGLLRLVYAGEVSRAAFRLRFIGTVMVTTTFLTVLLFFLPFFGWGRLYAGPNFWFHLVIPLASGAGFFLLPGGHRISAAETLLPVVPVFLYAAFYVTNILVNGKGAWPRTNDWYGFLTWGWGVGWGIFAGIALATWLAGLVLRAVYHRTGERRRGEGRKHRP